MKKAKASQSNTPIATTNKYDARFIILFILSSLLSLTLFVLSFRTFRPCIGACAANQITTSAAFVKELMVFTVIPAALGLYVSIRPLFLIRKTTFKCKTKIVLTVIALLLLFNTLVTPFAIAVEWTHKDVAEQFEARMEKMNNCLLDLRHYNSETHYEDINVHIKPFHVSELNDGSFDQFLLDGEASSRQAFKHCVEIKNADSKRIDKELEELADYCKHTTQDWWCSTIEMSKDRVDDMAY